MAGTIVILNELAGLPRPAERSDIPEGRVALDCFVKIDGPDGYQRRDGRADRYDVDPGTYRVRVRWAYYRSNAVQPLREPGENFPRHGMDARCADPEPSQAAEPEPAGFRVARESFQIRSAIRIPWRRVNGE